MKEEQLSPNLLEALSNYADESADILLAEAEKYEFEPDASHTEKMQSLVFKENVPLKKTHYKWFRNNAYKKVAVIIIAFVLASTCTVMSVEALRSAVFDFIMSRFTEYTEIYTDAQEYPDTIETVIVPSYIPEGYQQVDDESDYLTTFTDIVYYNPNLPDDRAYLHYSQMAIDSGASINTKGTEFKDITIGDLDGLIAYPEQGYIALYWSDGVYSYYLSAHLELDELLKIAESLEGI